MTAFPEGWMPEPLAMLTPEEAAADDSSRKAVQREVYGPRMWCPCHGEGGSYYAPRQGYHYSQDRVQSFPCPQAREMKE